MRAKITAVLLALCLFTAGCSQQVSHPTHLPQTVPPIQVDGDPQGPPSLPTGWQVLPVGIVGRQPAAVFSLDGRSVYSMDQNGVVWNTMLDGSKPSQAVSQHQFQQFLISADEKKLIGVINGKRLTNGSLVMIDLATDSLQDLHVQVLDLLAWLPDSRYILVSRYIDPGVIKVGQLDLASGDVRWQISSPVKRTGVWLEGKENIVFASGLHDEPHGSASLSPDGESVILSAGYSGTGTAYRLHLASGQLEAYPRTEGNGFSVHYCPDGQHALLGWGQFSSLDLATGNLDTVEFDVKGLELILDIARNGQVLFSYHHNDKSYVVISPACPSAGSLTGSHPQ